MEEKKSPLSLIVIILFTIFTIWVAVDGVPNYLRSRAGGMYNQCQANCKNIGAALEIYADDNNGLYPDRLDKLTPDYLAIIPTCAGSETNTGYISSYKRSKTGDNYVFYCSGKNHGILNIDENYPQYNSESGLIPLQKNRQNRGFGWILEKWGF